MKTYLQIVNAVLTRLREETVAQVPLQTYSNQIGALVNSAKREVEDAWPWSHLWTELDVATSSGTSEYTLTGWGYRSSVKDVYDITGSSRLHSLTRERWRTLTDIGTAASGRPNYYRIKSYDSGDPVMEVYPTPDDIRTLRVYGHVSQADLAMDDDELSVPEWPVILGAYARAVSERGEDQGAMYDETLREYHSALNDAIARDNEVHAMGRGSDWMLE